ncbi:hypothetical protein MMC22_000532 [Lobaria immixta]|nr:hypothetical protein [Lobaria immixta]
MAGFVAGAIVEVEKGNDEYYVRQVHTENPLLLPFPGSKAARKKISWGFGPLNVAGYVDTSSLEIGVEVSILGITLGSFSGNLNDGVMINLDLLLAKGSVKFHLKNGKELWVRIDVDVQFDGKYHEDLEIFSW